ncbi:MAG: protein kinase [Isosphaeraceae bacterium]
MRRPMSDCEPRLLRLSLEDRLSEPDQARLAEHLEACEACRQELERLAAATGFWGDARLLQGEPEPRTEPDEGDADDGGSAWLRLLDPPEPDRPDLLGRLGDYEVVEILGQGGMGVVLKAHDPSLDRTVAIKLLNPALAHGPNARRRFAREARAAAAVAHEHIVAIYAVDEFRGLPYLVMQYIGGRSLQERLDATGPLTVPEILRIGTQAARALAAAHAQGVVHRDIKPANILLENCVERVKLSDFGLARAVDDASLTMSGVIAGTPQYMAPEQARGEPVDARSDLFSLGAVIYAMAGGRPPFRADSALAVLKRVCEDDHRPIRELNPEIPDWLEAIIDRLLAKDRDDRFASAAEVADLLERGLAHVQQPTMVPLPVIPGMTAMAGPAAHDLEFDLPAAKPTRRSRYHMVAAACAALFLLGSLSISEASGLTRITDFVATILRIRTPEGILLVKVDDPGIAVGVDGETVAITGAGPREIRVRAGQHRIHASRGGRPIRDEVITVVRGGKEVVHIESEPPGPGDVLAVAPLPPVPPAAPVPPPSGDLVYEERPLPPLQSGPVWGLAFAPDGRRLAIAQGRRDVGPGALRILDVVGKKYLASLPNPSGYRTVAFSRNGELVAAVLSDRTLQLWRTDGGAPRPLPWHNAQGSLGETVCFLPKSNQPVCALKDGRVLYGIETAHMIQFQHPGKVLALAVSRDEKLLAVAGSTGVIHLHEVETGAFKGTLEGHEKDVVSLDFSPDGKLLASASLDRTLKLWDVKDRRLVGTLTHPENERLAVRFSPDGKTVAVADGRLDAKQGETFPCTVELWEPESCKLLLTLRGHTASIPALAFSPDGKMLASGGLDQTVRLWNPENGDLLDTIYPGETSWRTEVRGETRAEVHVPPPAAPATPAVPATPAAAPIPAPAPTPPAEPALPEGATLAPGQHAPASRPGPVWGLAFAPDGRRLAIAQGRRNAESGALRILDVVGEKDLASLPNPGGYRSVAFSPDGKLLAAVSFSQELHLWRTDGGTPRSIAWHQVTGHIGETVAFLPWSNLPVCALDDGRVVFGIGKDKVLQLQNPGKPLALAVSPDEGRIAIAGTAGVIHIHDVATGRHRAELRGHEKDVMSLDFSPDGKHLASAGRDGTVRLWDLAGDDKARILAHAEEFLAVRFSPDGRHLACATGRLDVPPSELSPCLIQLWAWTEGTLVGLLSGHTASIPALAFSPDGKTLASGSMDGRVKLWDVQSGTLQSTIISRATKPGPAASVVPNPAAAPAPAASPSSPAR